MLSYIYICKDIVCKKLPIPQYLCYCVLHQIKTLKAIPAWCPRCLLDILEVHKNIHCHIDSSSFHVFFPLLQRVTALTTTPLDKDMIDPHVDQFPGWLILWTRTLAYQEVSHRLEDPTWRQDFSSGQCLSQLNDYNATGHLNELILFHCCQCHSSSMFHG